MAWIAFERTSGTWGKGELFGTWSAWLQRVLRGFLSWAKRTRAAGDWAAYRCSILADRAVVFRFRSIHESLNIETATLYTDSSKLFRTTAIHRWTDEVATFRKEPEASHAMAPKKGKKPEAAAPAAPAAPNEGQNSWRQVLEQVGRQLSSDETGRSLSQAVRWFQVFCSLRLTCDFEIEVDPTIG